MSKAKIFGVRPNQTTGMLLDSWGRAIYLALYRPAMPFGNRKNILEDLFS